MLSHYLQFTSFEEADCLIDGVPSLQCAEVVFTNVLFLSAIVVVIILFVMIVIGSFQYMMSRGKPDEMQKASGTIKWAFVGLILFMSSYLILNVIQLLFIGDPDDPDNPSLLEFRIPEFNPDGSRTR